MLVGTGLGAAADINGRYVIRNVSADRTSFALSYIGYKSIEVHLDIKEGANVNHDFALKMWGSEERGSS